MSVLVWVLIGVALWHFTVLLPDRFHGGIIGAFLYAVGGAVLTGWALPEPGLPPVSTTSAQTSPQPRSRTAA